MTGGGSSSASTTSCDDHVFVGVVVRPFSQLDKRAEASPGCVTAQGPNSVLLRGEKQKDRTFDFDAVIDCGAASSASSGAAAAAAASQQRCFSVFGAPLVEAVQQGYGAAIFAYGQTGTGKTTAIVGRLEPAAQRGLLPRVLSELLGGDGVGTGPVRCRASMLEVYNERIRDLLTPQDASSPKLDVRLHPKLGPYVPMLTESAVESMADALSLLSYGTALRTIASTGMNHQSSRAHTLFLLKLELPRCGSGAHVGASDLSDRSPFAAGSALVPLTLVDLAGRENERTTLATGERLVELSLINKSLFHLSNCICTLRAQQSSQGRRSSQQQALFRNSKLTMLLVDALNGNSRTSMIGTLSPASTSYDDNLSTLRFASTVRRLTVRPVRNTTNKDSLAASLATEVGTLRQRLAALAQGGAAASQERERLMQELQGLSELWRRLDETWADASKRSQRQRLDSEGALARLGIGLADPAGSDGDDSQEDVVRVPSGAQTRRRMDSHAMLGFSFDDTALLENNETAWLLKNVSDDPYLSGTLIISLLPGHSVRVGSAPGSSPGAVTLSGLGIPKHLCTLVHKTAGGEARGELRVEVGGAIADEQDEGVVEVNGHRLSPLEEVDLRHRDFIVFGLGAYVFEVHCGGAHDDDSSSSRCSRSQRAPRPLPVGPPYAPLPFPLVDRATRGGCDDAYLFQRLVDEANMITRRVRPGSGEEFRLGKVIDWSPLPQGEDRAGASSQSKPKLIVQLLALRGPRARPLPASSIFELEPPGSGSDSEGTHRAEINGCRKGEEHIAAVWSVGKFATRLEIMRDIYFDFCEAESRDESYSMSEGKRREQPDPWADDWYFAEAMCAWQRQQLNEERSMRDAVHGSDTPISSVSAARFVGNMPSTASHGGEAIPISSVVAGSASPVSHTASISSASQLMRAMPSDGRPCGANRVSATPSMSPKSAGVHGFAAKAWSVASSAPTSPVANGVSTAGVSFRSVTRRASERPAGPIRPSNGLLSSHQTSSAVSLLASQTIAPRPLMSQPAPAPIGVKSIIQR